MRWALLVLVGCGRVGFDPRTGDGAPAGSDTGIDAIPGSPLLYIPFEDDPSGGTLVDRSGNAFHGTCTPGSTCPMQIQGKRGLAAQFDGSRYGVVPYRPQLDAASLTLAAWVYGDEIAFHVPVAKPLGADDRDSYLLVAWVDRTCAETTGVALAYDNVCYMTPLSIQRWYHLALRVESGQKTLFIDGVNVGMITGTMNTYDTHDLHIGCDNNAGTPQLFWNGRIDEVLLYDRALSDPDIAALAAP